MPAKLLASGAWCVCEWSEGGSEEEGSMEVEEAKGFENFSRQLSVGNVKFSQLANHSNSSSFFT